MWTVQDQKRADACDVIVIGAGIVGAAVAARLAPEGVEIAVLEAQKVAAGATGRGAGLVLTGLGSHYARAATEFGREQAREIWELTVEGRQRLVATAESLDVPVGATGSLTVAIDDAEADMLRESASLLREDGFDAWFGYTDPMNRGFRAAMRSPGDVTVDAAALTRALLSSNAVIVHEETEVYSLEPDGDGLRVWARDRTARCNAVVLAIDGYAPLFDSYFIDKVAPIRGLILATGPQESTVLEQPCCANHGHVYCRQLPDRRLLLGKWRGPRASGQEVELDDVLQKELLHFASRHFPEVQAGVADRWSGLGGFTSDGLPLVGRLPDLPSVYFAVGLGDRGLAWAFVVAEQVAELMLHDRDPGLLSAARLD